MIGLIGLGFALLVLVMSGFTIAALRSLSDAGLLRRLRQTVVVVWGLGMLFTGFTWLVERDWVHTLWAVAMPMTAMLAIAGPLLLAWADPHGERGHRGWLGRDRLRAGWSFMGMTLALGALPLVLVTVLPAMRGRNVGDAPSGVAALVAWGVGGPLPEVLTPVTAGELARGVGHLPREVTLSIGALMQASWVVLLACALGVAGRWLPGDLVRRTFLLLAPFVVTASLLIACAAGVGKESPLFDARLLVPIGNESTGLWTSDPVTLRVFGPVLLAALLAALLIPPMVALGPRREGAGQRARPAANPPREFPFTPPG